MEATQAQLLTLLDGRKQFIIPIYQRTYSWQIRQCEQLCNDIYRVGTDENQISHFIGSIVSNSGNHFLGYFGIVPFDK